MFGPTRPSVKSYLRLTESFQFSSVQSLSHVWLFANPWTAARQASLSITNTQSLLKLMSTKPVMPSNHLHPLLSPSPPAFNFSQHQDLFQRVSSSHQLTKVLVFQYSFNEYSRLISFRINWLDLLTVQGTLKSLLHTTAKKQYFGIQPSLWSNFHIYTWLLEKP